MNKTATGQPINADFRRSAKKRRSTNSIKIKKAEKSARDSSNRQSEDLRKRIEQEPIVDNEKVRKIKAAIQAGTYVVDAENIAKKLMHLEEELTKPVKE